MPEQFLSNRYFRQLTAAQLINADGFERRGVNAGRANREMRRRAAIEGYSGPYEWLAAHIPSRPPHETLRYFLEERQKLVLGLMAVWEQAFLEGGT